MIGILSPDRRSTAVQLRALSWMLGIACLALLAIALLKGLYALADTAMPGLEAVFMKPIGNLIAHLYAIPASKAPGITFWFWSLAPDLYLRGTLFSMGNLGFFATYAVMLLSAWLRARSTRTIHAIDDRAHRLREIQWDESVRQQVRGQVSRDGAAPSASTRTPLPPDNTPRPPWHQTLWGIVLLGIALPVAADLVKILIGMAKWP